MHAEGIKRSLGNGKGYSIAEGTTSQLKYYL